jgi:hypothetical protein
VFFDVLFSTGKATPVQMATITNSGQQYTTHEELAKTLGVFGNGWSSGNECKNGEVCILFMVFQFLFRLFFPLIFLIGQYGRPYVSCFSFSDW